MSAHVVQLLLGLFLLANGALVYMKGLTLFQSDNSTDPMAWIALSLGAIFLLAFAGLLFVFGGAAGAHLVAMLA